jgi:predicted membrane channel-forming protein YqfA (hemolysin III family)
MRKYKPTKEDKQDRKASIYILIASSILTILILSLTEM